MFDSLTYPFCQLNLKTGDKTIKVIDTHTHFFPDAIAVRAVEKLRDTANSKNYADGTLACLRACMEHDGVAQAVALPVATNPTKVEHMNDGFVDFLQTKTDDTIIQFGAMHPDCPTWREELHRLKREGFIGFKIHPVYNGVPFDDIRFLRIFDLAGELGLFTYTHAGYDIGFPGDECALSGKIRNAIDTVGDFPLVCAHMGSWKEWDKVVENLGPTKAYIDTAFSTGSFVPLHEGWSKEFTKMLTAEEFVAIVRAFGAERVMFASDSPWSSQAESIDFIKSSGLTQDEQELVFHQNAERIFGI